MGRIKRDRLMRAAMARAEQLIRKARGDGFEAACAFCELLGRTDKGDWYELTPFQREWIRAIHEEPKLLLMAPPEFGKSELITRLYVAWHIGKYPAKKVAIVRDSKTEVEKSVQAVSALIQEHPLFRAVFPKIRMARGKLAKDANYGFKIHVPGDYSRDLTLQGFTWENLKGNIRVHLLCVDDVLGFDNTRTHHQREKYIEKWTNIYANRVVEGGHIAFLTNAHHPQDLAHHLAKLPGWIAIKDQAVVGARSAEAWTSDPDAVPLWRRWWPLKRLLSKLADIGPVAFGRKFLNIAIDEATQRFRPEWIAGCLRLGKGRTFETSSPARCVISIDLGTREDKTSDLTVFFVHEPRPQNRRKLLNIESARLNSPDMLDRMRNLHERYPNAIFVPESNAAQIWLAQFGRDVVGLPILGFTTTGENKWDETWGVESLAVEIYNGRWILPAGKWEPNDDLHNLNGLHPEIKALIEELLIYRPDSHTGDRMMAMWIGREAARLGAAGLVKFNAQAR